MRISLKWLSKYIDVKEFQSDPKKLASLLTNAGLEVESIVDQSGQFKNVVIGQILDKQKHPNADLLTYCHVDVGTDKRWIVCGAKNHKAQDKVVVALPGAVLPGNFEIKLSKIRGQESHGMLCSLKELGLAEDGEGIIILPENAPVGESFAKYQGLDDVLLDIKVTPNRADCLSHLGLAREISAITGKPFDFPIKPFREGRESTRRTIKLRVDDVERCPRYAGRVIKGVKVGPSPDWLKTSLEAVGQRSINNVVDITNFVMLEMGQPLHAFDLAQLGGSEVVVRSANKGEVFTTLDEIKITLDGSELLICDAQKPVALAGVKGGLNSGVTEATKDLFLEAALFLPWTVRKTSRLHGIDTDSSYRFSRGVDAEGVLLALNRATQLFVEVCGGEALGEIWDNYPKPVAKSKIDFDLNFVNQRLGVPVTLHEARKYLERIGCQVTLSGNKLIVNTPGWRQDLKIQEDLGEEILRLKGYESIPETIPVGSLEPQSHDWIYSQTRRLAGLLRDQGLCESVTYGFLASATQQKILGTVRGDSNELGLEMNLKPVELLNPLNQDLDVMRVSLLPWLVTGAAHNVRHGQTQGSIFEVGSVFAAKEAEVYGEMRPFTEMTRLGLAIWGEESPKGNLSYVQKAFSFFALKGVLESVFGHLGLRAVKFEALKNTPEFLHPGQCARVVVEGKPVGFVGTLHPGKAQELEIRGQLAVAELDFAKLMAGQPRVSRIQSISKFPAVSRDVALLGSVDVGSAQIQQELVKAAGKLLISCDLFDLYEGEKLEKGKRSLAYHLVYQDPTRTLSDEEVNQLHQKAVQSVCQKLGLAVR